VRTATYSSRDFSGLDVVLGEFLAGERPGSAPPGTGIAGPLIDTRTKTANLPWTVDGAELARAFLIPRVELINDLVAMAEGVQTLGAGELDVLHEEVSDRGGQAALVAAGTGLGIATLARHPEEDRF